MVATFIYCATNGSRIEKDGQVVFEFRMVQDVYMVSTLRHDRQPMTKELFQEMVLSAINETVETSQPHMGSQMQFYTRLGHTAFESIERMDKDPYSGRKITCHKRYKFVTNSQGKGKRTAQPTK